MKRRCVLNDKGAENNVANEGGWGGKKRRGKELNEEFRSLELGEIL